jgi:hypothetical protein
MDKDLEEREKRFLKVLEHDEQKPPKKPEGKQRPITSTQPSRAPKQKVVDYSKPDEEVSQKFTTFEIEDKAFNKDLKVEEETQDHDLNDVIKLMNSNNENTEEQKKEFNFQSKGYQLNTEFNKEIKRDTKILSKQEEEYDYLDYQDNLDNLKRIKDEQAKFDYLENDLDS